jgi:hypothetical protein
MALGLIFQTMRFWYGLECHPVSLHFRLSHLKILEYTGRSFREAHCPHWFLIDMDVGLMGCR